MKDAHRDYARARDRLLAARAELAAAEAGMRPAEDKVRDEFNAAWDANQQAIAVADAALTTAQQRQAEVETEAGLAARARYLKAGGVGLVFLNQDEQAQVDQARAAVAEKRQAAIDARAAFKAGVTAEQLAAPGTPDGV